MNPQTITLNVQDVLAVVAWFGFFLVGYSVRGVVDAIRRAKGQKP